MLEGVDPSPDSIVLELGPGTGAFTKVISGIVKDNESYLGIELNKDLVKILRKKYPNLRFMRGNAYAAAALHKRSQLGKVRYIISGLPFVTMPTPVSEKVFRQVEKFMEKGCLFRTFQYAHSYYLSPAAKMRKFMQDRYGDYEKSSLIVKNVPPAFILTWETKKTT